MGGTSLKLKKVVGIVAPHRSNSTPDGVFETGLLVCPPEKKRRSMLGDGKPSTRQESKTRLSLRRS
jgi:hypothetical protein